MRDVVIAGAGRSATGRRNGTLSETTPSDICVPVLKETLRRARVSPEQVEFLVGGCITQAGEQSFNITRSIALLADIPIEVPAVTIDFQCGSSQQAIHLAADMIAAGTADIAVALGVENMSRVPMGANYLNGPGKPFTPELVAKYQITRQGTAAENIAVEYGINREEADEFGARSHQLAARAQKLGYFDDEIVPLTVQTNGESARFTEDETIRPKTTPEVLATLKPSFRPTGIHHAGNSSQICDQASVVVLMAADKARELGIPARARIVAHAAVGSDPHLMLTGPITATPKVLSRAGLTLQDMDVIEINEAFASVVLAWAKELNPDMARVNPNGGAIALGHALGSTGCRLMTSMLHELERTGGRYGLETMCCGGGLATATIIERL
jgi:acetyl-CoA acyltransferase